MNYRHAKEYSAYLEKACTLAGRDFSKARKFGEWLSDRFALQNLRGQELSCESGLLFLVAIKRLTEQLACAQNARQLRSLLDAQKEALQQTMPRPHISFFTQEFFLWPSFQSVWEAYQENADTDIVFAYDLDAEAKINGQANAMDKHREEIAAYHNAGYPILTAKEYDIHSVSPDVVFYMKPYKNFRGCPDDLFVKAVCEHVPYTVFISYCMDVQGGDALREYFYGKPAFYYMWRIIGYSNYYKNMMIRYGFRNGENVVTLGHPKFDVSHDLAIRRDFVYPEWEQKIAGRKVIFWNSHFSVLPGKGVGTFIQWRDLIFTYFKKHTDVVLLWRPHPLFWETMRRNYPAQRAEFNVFLRDLETWPNVIIDKTGDYRYAFCMSDALISDAATFLVEYCASGKPVLYTVKQDGEKVCNDDYLVGLQIAETAESITGFIDGIRQGRSEGSDTRKSQFEKIFGRCDGKVGQRIAQYVLAEMDDDITRRTEKNLACFEEELKNDVE